MRKSVVAFALACFMLTGCSGQSPALGGPTPTQFIITLTLPPTPIPTETLTPLPPTPSPTIAPVEGMTTTQVNVRREPAAGAAQVGILGPFVKVQIMGQDPTSTWYRIVYPDAPDGLGWVSAQFINLPVNGEIPTVPVAGTAAPSNETATPAPSGTVLQQVNVLKGPGTEFDALGMLNAREAVRLTGRDLSGQWLEVHYEGAPGGKGWIPASYVQATSADALPIIGQVSAKAGTV